MTHKQDREILSRILNSLLQAKYVFETPFEVNRQIKSSESGLRLCLTFTAWQRVAPLSFILALEHRLPQQVKARITGQLDLGAGAHFHSGCMQVGHSMLQLGAIWRDRERFSVLDFDERVQRY